MGVKSTIAWTDATWNPVTGCSKVSPGCAHCYAETLSRRYKTTTQPWIPANAAANVVVHPDRLISPLRWKTPRLIFVNSMSDLFHERVPDAFLDQVFAVMALTPQHTYQVLTKRPERMQAYLSRPTIHARWDAYSAGLAQGVVVSPQLVDEFAERVRLDPSWRPPFPLPNVWLGVSVENQHWADMRIPLLLETPAAVRFISAEPLLSALDLSQQLGAPGLDWVIIGGESGRHMSKPQYKHRWMRTEWAQDIVDQCRAAGVPVFYKQRSGLRPGQHPELNGIRYKEFPVVVGTQGV